MLLTVLVHDEISSEASLQVGIIGGSGLNKASFFTLEKKEKVSTPFGEPSDDLQHGTISGVPCILLPR